jgi:hypothetical protein
MAALRSTKNGGWPRYSCQTEAKSANKPINLTPCPLGALVWAKPVVGTAQVMATLGAIADEKTDG